MKQTMKNILIAGAAIVSGAVLPASAAETLKVNVPFAFMVGNTKMAAGVYNVTESNNGMVLLNGEKTSAIVLTVPGRGASESTALRFNSNLNPSLTGIQLSGYAPREVPLHTVEHKTSLVSSR